MSQHALKSITKIASNLHLRNVYKPVTASAQILKNDLCTSCLRNKDMLANTHGYGLKKPSIIENMVDKVKLNFQRHKLQAAGYYLYECVADEVDHAAFMKEFNMADTFNSWFLITELHVWMVIARMMVDPSHGRIVRNAVVEALWRDVVLRCKKLETEQTDVIKTQIMQLSEEFQAALVTYDEGILSDDTVLACAVWRRILSRQCEARQLEAMVKYVRQTMFYLHKLTNEEFIMQRKIKWIPISEVFKSLPT